MHSAARVVACAQPACGGRGVGVGSVGPNMVEFNPTSVPAPSAATATTSPKRPRRRRTDRPPGALTGWPGRSRGGLAVKRPRIARGTHHVGACHHGPPMRRGVDAASRTGRILRRVHEDVPSRRDREVALAPAGHLVELGGVVDGKDLARLPVAMTACRGAAHANMIHTFFRIRDAFSDCLTAPHDWS